MPVSENDVKVLERKTRDLRSRYISHRRRGVGAPRLRKAYLRNKGELAHAKRLLAREHSPRRIACQWAIAHEGWTEQPASSNRGPGITELQRSFGDYLVGQPWCGVFVGGALRAAGVHVTARVASVALIEDDARAGRYGFERLTLITGAKVGDCVILFGRGVHVELIVGIGQGYFLTVGGNTSPEGGSGSQSNGGGSYARRRAFSNVHAIAVPAYPKGDH